MEQRIIKENRESSKYPGGRGLAGRSGVTALAQPRCLTVRTCPARRVGRCQRTPPRVLIPFRAHETFLCAHT